MSLMERSLPRLIKPLPKVCFRCSLLSSRNFHTTRHPSARPAPRVRLQQRADIQRAAPVNRSKSYGIEDCLPPLPLLEGVHKAGLLDIEPDKAIDFLKSYLSVAQYRVTGWEQRLCKEQDITPSTIGVIAGILRRCMTDAQHALGKTLLFLASELGDKAATFEIISAALRQGDMEKCQPVLQRLGLMAKREGDPKAMFLLAKCLYAERAEKQALEWIRKATRPPTGNFEFDGAGEALVLEGLILARSGQDKEGAKSAWSTAATQLDDPNAYFYLSQLASSDGDLATQKVYLLKAASAGMTDAWHNLGVLALEEVQKEGVVPEKIEDYGMAMEWFHVAAMNGFGLSMLNVAQMYRSVGDVAAGVEWLDRAEAECEDRDVVRQARRLKEEWMVGMDSDLVDEETEQDQEENGDRERVEMYSSNDRYEEKEEDEILPLRSSSRSSRGPRERRRRRLSM